MPSKLKSKTYLFSEFQSKAGYMIWVLTKTGVTNLQACVPSRERYHSLLTGTKPLTRVCGLPLLMAHASDWSTSILNSTQTSPGHKLSKAYTFLALYKKISSYFWLLGKGAFHQAHYQGMIWEAHIVPIPKFCHTHLTKDGQSMKMFIVQWKL